MPRILITAGPTREYLDPVRYLSNASSGKMGVALAKAALSVGYDATIVSGPVGCEYPQDAAVIRVTTTDEMLDACLQVFPECIGAIGAAAPCDFRPKFVATDKIKKNNTFPLTLEMIATPDIFAALGEIKRQDQWLVPFALETVENGKNYALDKLRRKNGDFIILNRPQSLFADEAEVEILDKTGATLATLHDTKDRIATQLINMLVVRKSL